MIPTPKGQTPPAPGQDTEEPEFSPGELDIPRDDRRGTAPDNERVPASDKPRGDDAQAAADATGQVHDQPCDKPSAPDAFVTDTVRPEDQSDG